MTPEKQKELYRYTAEYESSDGDLPGFRLGAFKVIRETEKTYFIDAYRPKLKRVPKSGFNIFAHSTKEAAFEHLERRLTKRISWYHFWIDNCERALKVMKEVGIKDFADESDLNS